MDDWLSKEWADHQAQFSADLSTGIARIVIRLRNMGSAGFWRRRTRTRG
jgi:hypothetical protein